MYEIPHRLEKLLLDYTKKTYLPDRRHNPKHEDAFTAHDIRFFARGVAQMSAYFTSERSDLPQNYFNKKELRAGYILYFVMANFLKVSFCLNELDIPNRFMEARPVKILDVGCGPGTVSLACADHWRNHSQKIEIIAIDQNTGSLHDAKHLFGQFAPENATIKTVFSNIWPKSISRAASGKYHIIFLANFLSELKNPEDQAAIISTLLERHLERNGVLVIIEPSLRWTTRSLMKLRDDILRPADRPATQPEVLSPCLHRGPCPMLKQNNRDWCHMYLEWRRPRVIEDIDYLIGNRKNYLKFSYMIFSKGGDLSATRPHDLWRAVSAPMRSKGKIELLLCNMTCHEKGLMRVIRQDRDASEQNSDFDNTSRGDLVSYKGQGRIDKTTVFKLCRR